MRLSLLTLTAFFLFSCKSPSQSILDTVAPLPKKIKEASASEVVVGKDWIWTVEDQKNEPIVYAVDQQGKLVKEIRLTNVSNNDWEDLTSDKEGNLYIGDFGNNDNERQNLAIYKVDKAHLEKDEAEVSSVIQFYYPEQKEFPPKKKERVFDVESFFYFNNNFYLFTKNRSSKFDGTTVLYKVPNRMGEKVAAQKISEFVTCGNFNHCAITSAAISPSGKKMALLSSDKVWLFTDFEGDNFFSGKVQKIELDHFSQKEGIGFENETTLLITDEAEKKGQGNIYRLKLK